MNKLNKKIPKLIEHVETVKAVFGKIKNLIPIIKIEKRKTFEEPKINKTPNTKDVSSTKEEKIEEKFLNTTFIRARSLMARLEINDVLKKIEKHTQNYESLKKKQKQIEEEISFIEKNLTQLNKQKDTFVKFINEDK